MLCYQRTNALFSEREPSRLLLVVTRRQAHTHITEEAEPFKQASRLHRRGPLEF